MNRLVTLSTVLVAAMLTLALGACPSGGGGGGGGDDGFCPDLSNDEIERDCQWADQLECLCWEDADPTFPMPAHWCTEVDNGAISPTTDQWVCITDYIANGVTCGEDEVPFAYANVEAACGDITPDGNGTLTLVNGTVYEFVETYTYDVGTEAWSLIYSEPFAAGAQLSRDVPAATYVVYGFDQAGGTSTPGNCWNFSEQVAVSAGGSATATISPDLTNCP
jgi:hypothetical protein